MSVVSEVPKELPFLKAVCWQTADVKHFTPEEMLRRYERGWHYLDLLGVPSSEEFIFIKNLAKTYGSWLAAERMFKLELHQKIKVILNSVNADCFSNYSAYFGGGTLVSLKHDEHRVSKDIDFICPLGEGYRLLREQVASRGYSAIFTSLNNIALPREIQVNRYGVRFPVVVDETTIKFEIVIEERIQLGTPEYLSWCPVPCLNETDSIAEKLLANSDRWIDTSVESRDLIDLAVQRLASPFPREAVDKAENAYPVMEPLKRAIINFQDKPDYRERCYSSLQISSPKTIVDGLDLLASDFGLEATQRILSESQM